MYKNKTVYIHFVKIYKFDFKTNIEISNKFENISKT